MRPRAELGAVDLREARRGGWLHVELFKDLHERHLELALDHGEGNGGFKALNPVLQRDQFVERRLRQHVGTDRKHLAHLHIGRA